jgi:outer membrane protein assembly factor BamA
LLGSGGVLDPGAGGCGVARGGTRRVASRRRDGLHRRLVVFVCLASASVAPVGCKRGPSAAELRGADSIIRRVEFEGAERFDDREIHRYLELRPTTYLPLPTRRWFYPGLIPTDIERIVELYQAHGYYEAQVLDVEVETHERRRRDRVDIHYAIDEGPVTRVEEVVVRWPEGPPPGPPRAERETVVFDEVPGVRPQQVSRAVAIAAGDPFEVLAMQRSSEALRERLRRAGHPFVEVDQRALIHRAEQRARVEFTVRPGPYLRIGEIHILGLETVPIRPVRVEVQDLQGKPYSPARMQVIEQRIYAIGMFSTVSVELERRSPEDERDNGEVDVIVRVRESDAQRVRLGVALGFEPNRWEQRFVARYQHQNLFRNLYKLSLTGRVGYAELPNLLRLLAHGPVVQVDLHVEKKGLLEKHLIWSLDPGVELGIDQGYQFGAVKHRFGVARFFTRWFQLELSHSLRYVDFFNVSPQLEAGSTLLGLDFRDPYLISYVGVRPTIWAVDQIAAPNDGVVLGAEYRVAGGPFGGHYDYQEVAPFLRAYWRPIDRLQLAARARVGMIFPFGDQPGAPIDMRRYLGGTATVRGWGLRRLAPRIDNCEPGQSPVTGACESIPVGGNTEVLGNVELRVRAWGKLWTAAFLDVGDVRAGRLDFVPTQWNYSTGAGLRYDSPIGKFRLDVGFRLNETELSRGEPIWALHFGLGESF